jgi:hypothetical protein
MRASAALLQSPSALSAHDLHSDLVMMFGQGPTGSPGQADAPMPVFVTEQYSRMRVLSHALGAFLNFIHSASEFWFAAMRRASYEQVTRLSRVYSLLTGSYGTVAFAEVAPTPANALQSLEASGVWHLYLYPGLMLVG